MIKKIFTKLTDLIIAGAFISLLLLLQYVFHVRSLYKEQIDAEAQMETLCKQDGGLKIYEKVILPKESFDEHGNPRLDWRNGLTIVGGHEYKIFRFYGVAEGAEKFESIKYSSLKKSITTISREATNLTAATKEANKKVLGTYTYYQDLRKKWSDSDKFILNIFGLSVPSSPWWVCPPFPGDYYLEKSIFNKAE